ncbi:MULTISPECIES: GNAT family N-acetyltransferase [unclassified Achromobacter]|uniref:GNAT family N-acetyltransferase n=1 Tax=unclassified Achromobacter TaxID=2626865 RepID=UPI000B51AE5B|nr:MULTISPECIES: GNAT family N-acetyltransferase [unclassified Achromobacter]OWT74755.1 GNAT family N-acetyltransferase [Achromobacter sp. HZ34]OWT79222.1 GNAT family N-acetyltransferase [Achromobacter sp. HZ28]
MQHEAPNPAPSTTLVYTPVTDGDLEALADLRAEAMRDSLERVGRFDPDRARQRLRDGWAPAHTWSIEFEGSRAGFYTLRPVDGGLKLDHLYILPAFQNLGLGGRVMQRIAALADEARLAVHLGALRDSPSNAFYQRHGYIKTGEDPWDIYYVRCAAG